MNPVCQLNWWERFLDSLDTSGGNIFIWCVFSLVAIIIFFANGELGTRLIDATLIGLVAYLRNNAKSNHTRKNSVQGNSNESQLSS